MQRPTTAKGKKGEIARFEPASGLRRVIAGVSTKPLDIAGSQVLFLALVIGPMILIISAATAWTLAGRLLRPIEQMVNDVEAISDGRSLHRRIPVEDSGDEIGRALQLLLSSGRARFVSQPAKRGPWLREIWYAV